MIGAVYLCTGQLNKCADVSPQFGSAGPPEGSITVGGGGIRDHGGQPPGAQEASLVSVTVAVGDRPLMLAVKATYAGREKPLVLAVKGHW